MSIASSIFLTRVCSSPWMELFSISCFSRAEFSFSTSLPRWVQVVQNCQKWKVAKIVSPRNSYQATNSNQSFNIFCLSEQFRNFICNAGKRQIKIWISQIKSTRKEWKRILLATSSILHVRCFLTFDKFSSTSSILFRSLSLRSLFCWSMLLLSLSPTKISCQKSYVFFIDVEFLVVCCIY